MITAVYFKSATIIVSPTLRAINGENLQGVVSLYTWYLYKNAGMKEMKAGSCESNAAQMKMTHAFK